MTVQAQEVVEYRGQNYWLIGAPLDQFLDLKPEIKFEIYTTAHMRGYQGYWLLENDRLLIKNIKSSSYSFADIFKVEIPILADWFTGILEFGIGDFASTDYGISYEDYVWMKIDKGIVIEKNIIKKNFEVPKFEFGKFKFRRFDELLYTKIYNHKSKTIKNFIEDLLFFLTDKDCKFKIIVPYFQINENDIDLINDIKKCGLKCFLTQNYIAVSTLENIENPNEKKALGFSLLLEKILSSDFRNTVVMTKNDLSIVEVSENSILINPNINYLTWVLKTIDAFCVPPNFLNQTFKIKHLKSFKINRLNDSVFEYEPIIKSFDYNFPEETIKINLDKFESKFKVLFNSELNYYVNDISEEDLIERYGYYLNELYSESFNKDSSNDSWANNNETYDDYNGSHAQDFENLSDQFINDILDGDPDAYWNID